MKRGRHHVGPVRRWLRFCAVIEERHRPLLSPGWLDRRYAQIRHGWRAREARLRSGIPIPKVGGPQAQGN